MVWFYVAVGLVIIIAILILMRVESGPLKRRYAKGAELITNVTYVCMHCGHAFEGSRCPKCGFDRKPLEFGR